MRLSNVIFEADEPIDEERARVLVVNEALRVPISVHLNEQQRRLRWSLGLGVLGVVAGVVAFAANVGGLVGGALLLGGIVVASAGTYTAQSSDPDVTVKRVEKGYWTGYRIPSNEGTIVYDATQSIRPAKFELELLADREGISTARTRLEAVGEFPVVMPENDDIESRVTKTLEEVQTVLDDAQETTVEAPIIPPGGEKAEFVGAMAEQANEDDVEVDVAVDIEKAEADVESLNDLETMADTADDNAELGTISETSRRLVGDLTGMQRTAVDLLNDHIQTAADAFGLVSYNFYCPDCKLDDIDSQASLSDPQDGEWYCGTCRSRHGTDEVIPEHRLKDDVINPLWDQLWIEKDDQRREVYENIEDQKTELKEREFEQRREEIRSSTDRIRKLRSKIRDLETKAKAAEGTVDEIGDLMVQYDRLARQRKKQFSADVEAAFAEIHEETEHILEQTRNEEQERLERAEREAEQRAKVLREEERRREWAKFAAEQRMENERLRAEQQMENSRVRAEMEQEAKFQREDIEMEQYGKLSSMDSIQRAHVWRERNLPGSGGRN